jgi:hypothetical protein
LFSIDWSWRNILWLNAQAKLPLRGMNQKKMPSRVFRPAGLPEIDNHESILHTIYGLCIFTNDLDPILRERNEQESPESHRKVNELQYLEQ